MKLYTYFFSFTFCILGNGLAQADEVEALSAIYGDEWCVIDEEAHIFCIRVSDQTQNGKWTLSIQVLLNIKNNNLIIFRIHFVFTL